MAAAQQVLGVEHVWAANGDEGKVLEYVKAATPPATDAPAA